MEDMIVNSIYIHSCILLQFSVQKGFLSLSAMPAVVGLEKSQQVLLAV